MKFYSLFLLFWGLSFSGGVWAEVNSACPVPKPFTKLNSADAETYALANILAHSSLSDAATIKDESNNLLGQQNSYKTQVQLINFWAAWCAPCRQELPFLDTISADKIVDVILINVGDEAEVAEEILAELEVAHVKTHLANGDVLSKLSLKGLPVSLVFSEKNVYLGLGKLKEEQAIKHWLKCLSEPIN